MEIAFYYSFKEFEKKYNIDLKNWRDTYPDADEIDYLNELRNKYQLFFYENNSDFIINSNWIPNEYPEHYELSIIAYHEFMQEKLIDYLYSKGFSNFDGDFLEIPFDTDVMDFWDDCNVRTRKNSAIIDDEKHKYLKEFFAFNNFMENLDFDSKKFTNFKFATKKILEFVDKKSQLITSKIEFELDKNNNEIIDLYQNANSENEKIEILSTYTFKLSKKNICTTDDLIDEEIDDLFFKTISELRNEIISENSNVLKYKLYKMYELPSKDNYDLNKPHEHENYVEDLVRISIKKNQQEKVLSKIHRGVILNHLDFRERTRDGGFYYNKNKIGYKIFLRFKKLWKFQNHEIIAKEVLVNNKDIFSKSQKIKIKGSLQSVGFLFSELIEKGFIEAPKRNGKDNTSAISRMILDHFEFIDKEEQPKPEDIRKTLFTENKLSIEKQNQFKIPQSKIINTD
jgi:hypothetical protein